MLQLFFNTFKLFTWDLAANLGYWPIWWYGPGLADFFKLIINRITAAWHNRALDILLKNWFKPMYAQTDWQGRILSFFFRTLIIIWRMTFFIIWALILLVGLVLWFIIIPIALFMLIRLLLFT